MKPYLPASIPTPKCANMHEDQFFSFCRKKQLRVPFCNSCKIFRHPTIPICPKCHGQVTEWQEIIGHGSIFSFTNCFHPVHPSVSQSVPYNVSVILLEETKDVRIVSNVVGINLDQIKIGLEVCLSWEKIGKTNYLPRFQPKNRI